MRYEKADGVAVFTLDNPPVNAFTPAIHKDFYAYLQDFIADDAIRVGIFTAIGTRAFSAGDDIKTPRVPRTQPEIVDRYLRTRKNDDSLEYPGWEMEVVQLQRFKPIIAAVNGPVMGQGFMYIMHLTDIRLATPNATFGLPEIRYGMPGAGGMFRMGLQMPHVIAMWLTLTGEPIDAAAALRYGVINEIVEGGKLLQRAHEVAGLITRQPALSIRTEMEAYYRAMDMTREQALAFSAHLSRLQRVVFPTSAPLAGK